MKFQVNNELYQVDIIRKNNKNTYVRIKENHTIVVTTGRFTTKKQILNLLNKNQKAIEKMALRCQKSVTDEEKIVFFGQTYDIMMVPDSKKIQIEGTRIYVPSTKKLQQWYQKKILELFQNRLDKWYHIIEEDIPYPKLKIRKMKTRWGVCNKKNQSITLNTELMKYSMEKLDYVIIHELSHFVQFNHSKEFWKVVEKYCPQYKKIRKELRT